LYFVYGPEQDPINLRREYLEHTLEISTRGDSSVYLLNPMIVGTDGEWEAWFFANWGPGAHRHQSFAEMMLAHYEDFQSKGLDGFKQRAVKINTAPPQALPESIDTGQGHCPQARGGASFFDVPNVTEDCIDVRKGSRTVILRSLVPKIAVAVA